MSAFECGAPNKTYTLSDSRGGTLGEHCRRRVAKEGDRCPAHRRTMTAPKKGTFLAEVLDHLRGCASSGPDGEGCAMVHIVDSMRGGTGGKVVYPGIHQRVSAALSTLKRRGLAENGYGTLGWSWFPTPYEGEK